MMLLINKMKRLKLMIVQKPASNTIEVIVIDLDDDEDFVEELEVKKEMHFIGDVKSLELKKNVKTKW